MNQMYLKTDSTSSKYMLKSKISLKRSSTKKTGSTQEELIRSLLTRNF